MTVVARGQIDEVRVVDQELRLVSHRRPHGPRDIKIIFEMSDVEVLADHNLLRQYPVSLVIGDMSSPPVTVVRPPPPPISPESNTIGALVAAAIAVGCGAMAFWASRQTRVEGVDAAVRRFQLLEVDE